MSIQSFFACFQKLRLPAGAVRALAGKAAPFALALALLAGGASEPLAYIKKQNHFHYGQKEQEKKKSHQSQRGKHKTSGKSSFHRAKKDFPNSAPAVPASATQAPSVPLPSAPAPTVPAPSASTPAVPAPSASTPISPTASTQSASVPTPAVPAPSASIPISPAPSTQSASVSTPTVPAPLALTPSAPANVAAGEKQKAVPVSLPACTSPAEHKETAPDAPCADGKTPPQETGSGATREAGVSQLTSIAESGAVKESKDSDAFPQLRTPASPNPALSKETQDASEANDFVCVLGGTAPRPICLLARAKTPCLNVSSSQGKQPPYPEEKKPQIPDMSDKESPRTSISADAVDAIGASSGAFLFWVALNEPGRGETRLNALKSALFFPSEDIGLVLLLPARAQSPVNLLQAGFATKTPPEGDKGNND